MGGAGDHTGDTPRRTSRRPKPAPPPSVDATDAGVKPTLTGTPRRRRPRMGLRSALRTVAPAAPLHVPTAVLTPVAHRHMVAGPTHRATRSLLKPPVCALASRDAPGPTWSLALPTADDDPAWPPVCARY